MDNKPSTTPVLRNMDAFEDAISLTKLHGQLLAVDLLSRISESLAFERFKKSHYKLPSILLLGRASRRLLAKSFANDLGLSNNFEEFYTDCIAMHWGYSGSLYTESPEECVYHLRFSDKCPSTPFISEMTFWLAHGYLLIQNGNPQGNTMLRRANKIFVFSADSLEQFEQYGQNLLPHIDHIIELNSAFSFADLALMIKQRCQFMGITIDDAAPLQIADRGRTPANIMRILRTAYMLATSDCRAHIALDDVQEAIRIFNKPVRPQPREKRPPRKL